MKYLGIIAAFITLTFVSCGGGDNMRASSSYPYDNYTYQYPGYYNNYQNFGYPGYYPPTGGYYMNQYERGYNNKDYVKAEDAHEMHEQGGHHHGGK